MIHDEKRYRLGPFMAALVILLGLCVPGSESLRAQNDPPPFAPQGQPNRNRPGPWDNDVIAYRTRAGNKVEKLATFPRAGVPTLAHFTEISFDVLQHTRCVRDARGLNFGCANLFEKRSLRKLNEFGRTELRCARAGMLWLLMVTATAGDWPAFRGPDGNGIAREDKAPLHWGPQENVRWKVALPGPGNSSPIVSRGRVFVTCAEEKGKKRNLFCFDRRTGKKLWVRTVEYPVVEPTHQSNPYCGSTPVAGGTRVIVWHGSAGVFCYNFDGKELWKKDLGEVRNEWGYGSSPILHRGKVILNFGPGDRAFLAALDLKTGKLLWKYDEPGGPKTVDRKNLGSWCTPIIARVGGRDQILCSMLTRLVACDPKTGAPLWFCEGLAEAMADLVYPSPVVSDGIGVAFSGWVNGPTFGLKLGGAGDVTASNRLWLEKQTQRVGSGVVVDGHVFIVNAGPGTAQCMECRTGKIRWTERLEGGESWGSVVLAAGRLYVTSRRGVTSVFRPDPEKFELLATNDLGEPSNATPAISEGQLFLRTDSHLYCIAEE